MNIFSGRSMNPESHLSALIHFIDTQKKKYNLSPFFLLLLVLLFAVIIISFVIPLAEFGRFFGTDDYSHLFHSRQMAQTNNLFGFYDSFAGLVSDPSSESNLYNYPFGLWLFGATISKITGLPVLYAGMIFVLLFVFILIASFYLYSGIFLDTKEQKILAILFLISMPNFALTVLSYRPSVFVLPFLFLALYITFKESVSWKLFLVVWFTIFLIILSHTGTFIFLITFALTFFLLNCLIWGKFSRTIYFLIFSSFVIYVISLRWFPEISNQYEAKSGLFLTASNFFASKLNIGLAADIGDIFYQNFLAEQQLIYAIFFGTFLFFMGKLFVYIHKKIAESLSGENTIFPITLPISNISHSAISTPIFIGPVQAVLSVLGVFRINSKGKNIFISTILIAVLPDFIQTQQGNIVATGALREMSYLIIIIPITAVLGLWTVLEYLEQRQFNYKSQIKSVFWILILCMTILIPILATTYYLPIISGENYIIDGMKWVGSNGNPQAGVVGYGYKTVPIYANMTDTSYGLQSGYETRTYVRLLRGVYFSSNEKDLKELQNTYGVTYLLSSKKLAANLGGSLDNVTIDRNSGVDKIFSSKDFGVYEIRTSWQKYDGPQILADNITLKNPGSSYQISSEDYMCVLNRNTPSIERFGTPRDNYLGMGFISDNVRIYGRGMNSTSVDQFNFNDVPFATQIQGNKITYTGVLTDKSLNINESSLTVIYTFYPKLIKREIIISNDWIALQNSPQMKVGFSTTLFVPMTDFIYSSDQLIQQRHIYPSQDSITKNDVYESVYVFNNNKGMLIKYGDTAPYPTSLTYKGSTLYNMSSMTFSQTDSLKPGTSLHITQYISRGSRITAEKKINSDEGVTLLDYPSGIVPIILAGYRTPVTDFGNLPDIDQGYTILKDQHIPYTEVINPLLTTKTQSDVNTTSEIEPNRTPVRLPPVNLAAITGNNFRVMGSTSTGSKTFNDLETQESSISELMSYGEGNSASFIGFMPVSLNYNLDTLRVLMDKKVSLMFSNPVNTPYKGYFEEGYRFPEFAMYQGSPTDIVLLPVSYPSSTTFISQPDNEETFSQWKSTIDEVANNDEMALFLIRSMEIGNPEYSDNFIDLFSYARESGLTFSSPDEITAYQQLLRNIKYIGSLEGDTAVIRVANHNLVSVDKVTFRVSVPILRNGSYEVNGGTIVRTKDGGSTQILYVSTDIPGQSEKTIIVAPMKDPQKLMNVKIHQRLLEDTVSVTIKDENGEPLRTADVIIDSEYYQPDKDGNVQIRLHRGPYTIHVQNPGYEPFLYNIEVKGRLALAEDSLRNLLKIPK